MRTLTFFITFFSAGTAHAQNAYSQYCEALGTYCGDGRAFVIHLATRIETIIVQFIVGAAICAVIYGALKIVTSAGDDGKKEEGKNIIVTALIGLVLAIAAHAVISYVAGFLTQAIGST